MAINTPTKPQLRAMRTIFNRTANPSRFRVYSAAWVNGNTFDAMLRRGWIYTYYQEQRPGKIGFPRKCVRLTALGLVIYRLHRHKVLSEPTCVWYERDRP